MTEIRRDPELERTIDEADDANRRRDVGFLATHTSSAEGTIALGSDATEVFRGRDGIVDGMREEYARMGEGEPFRFETEEREGWSAGDIGWSLSTGRLVLADGTTFGSRMTGVYRREDGVWKAVQLVMSLAVPNEALVPGSPLAVTAAG